MRVAPGREIDINGRRYLAGDELPPLAPRTEAQLIESGDIERPEPKRKERKE